MRQTTGFCNDGCLKMGGNPAAIWVRDDKHWEFGDPKSKKMERICQKFLGIWKHPSAEFLVIPNKESILQNKTVPKKDRKRRFTILDVLNVYLFLYLKIEP